MSFDLKRAEIGLESNLSSRADLDIVSVKLTRSQFLYH